MNCAEIERHLVEYHFDGLGQETRLRLEEHLFECPTCVHAFIVLKRSIEVVDDAPPVPSAARARLRRAVARELGIGSPAGSWWERPLALAVAASVVLAATATTRALATSAGAPPRALAVETR
jgi:anti-sigma factor RsiW